MEDRRRRTKAMTEDNKKIDVVVLLKDFLRVMRRMWIRVVALGIIFAVLLTVHANMNYTEYYTAYSSFTVNIWDEEDETGVSAYYDNAAAEQMATSFPYILTSGVLQRKVASDMGVEYISGTINASVVENTNIFTLSVTDVDPERAEQTLQAVIKNYPSVSEAIVGKLDMNILDESGVPTAPDNPKDLKQDALKGGLVGIVLGLAWAVLVTLLRKTIRTEEDCQKYINQRCLGSIPFVRIKERSDKSKRHLNITKKNIDPEFKEALRMVRNKMERYTGGGSMKRVMITSALSGEGKSTIAVNLALSLALEGKSVTLVDCDLRNPSDAGILNVETNQGLVDYLLGRAEFTDCVFQIANETDPKKRFKFFFVPGGQAVSDASNLLGSERMKWVIDVVSKTSDYVILDSAPVGLLTDAGVLAQFADCSMFVVKKDFARVEHIMTGIEHLAESNIPVVGCVINGD
jgi:capsular exopolysaccharide synthesis family protein